MDSINRGYVSYLKEVHLKEEQSIAGGGTKVIKNQDLCIPILCECVLSHFSHVHLCATLQTVACQSPLSMGIFLARILKWVATSSPRGSSQPKDPTHVSSGSCITGRFFTTDPWGKAQEVPRTVKLMESESTLMDARGGGGGRGNGDLEFNGDRVSVQKGEESGRWII